jgi:hypothetical protein
MNDEAQEMVESSQGRQQTLLFAFKKILLYEDYV